jgi:hypothetical protein
VSDDVDGNPVSEPAEEGRRGKKGKASNGEPPASLETPTVRDQRIFDWLEAVFYGIDDEEPEQNPERISLDIVSGRASQTVESTVWEQQYAAIKAIPEESTKRSARYGKPNKERLVALSNFILNQMQDNCDECGRKRTYALHAWSFNRAERPYMQLLRTLQPKGRKPVKAELLDDEDLDLDGEPLSHDRRFILRLFAETQKMFAMNSEVMVQIVDRFNRNEERLMTENDRLHRTITQKNEQLERSLSLQDERDEKREWRRLRREMAEKTWDAVETYGPLLAGKLLSGKKPAPHPSDAADIEVLRKFLRTTDEGGSLTPQQLITALGDWNKEGCVKPGILAPVQALILVHVAQGNTAPSDLDKLLPGGEHAIEARQFMALQGVFSPEQLEPLRDMITRRMTQRSK